MTTPTAEPPYANIPDLLHRAAALLAAADPAVGVPTDQWTDDQSKWLGDYGAALPAFTHPHGAVIDIVEDHLRADDYDPNKEPAILAPNRVSINGIPLRITQEGPVVERIDLRIGKQDAAVIAMRVFARRIRIDAERCPDPQTPAAT
jgi:hypothetical protein